MRCEDCEGSGYHPYYWTWRRGCKERATNINHGCPSCNGTGVIPPGADVEEDVEDANQTQAEIG